jgi:predicted transcriptional regulator
MDGRNYGFLDAGTKEETETVKEILKCANIDDVSDKNFLPAARFIFKIGTGEDSNNGTNDIERRTGLSPNTIQDYKSAYKRSGLIQVDKIGRKDVLSLSEDGKEIFEAIKPLFKEPGYISEVEEGLVTFKQIYLRNPTVNELSNFLQESLSEEDLLKTSVNWNSEEYSDEDKERVKEHISLGFVIKNTSAKDLLGADTRDLTRIGFSNSREGNINQEYVDKNGEFFDRLELQYNNGVFRLLFDDYTEFVLDESGYVFEVTEPEVVKEELKEIAEEAIF